MYFVFFPHKKKKELVNDQYLFFVMDGKGTECVAVGICIRLVWLIAPLGRVSVLVVGLKRLNKDCTGRICSSTPTSPYPAPFSASEILPSSEHTVKTAIAGLGSG